MMFQVSVSNNGRGNRNGDYFYTIQLNGKVIIEGKVKDINLQEYLSKLMGDFIKEALVSAAPAPKEEHSAHIPPPIPLENQQDRYLTSKETSKITGLSLGTLANNRHARKGLPFVKISDRAVRYKLSDVLAYMDQNKIDPQVLREKNRRILR